MKSSIAIFLISLYYLWLIKEINRLRKIDNASD